MVMKEVTLSKLDIKSCVSKPFTADGKCEHEDFHDHAIPLNQMAQKIPRLLDLEQPPSSSATISIMKQELGKSYYNFTYKLNIKCLIY